VRFKAEAQARTRTFYLFGTALLAVGLIALSGCGSSSSSGSEETSSSSTPTESTPAASGSSEETKSTESSSSSASGEESSGGGSSSLSLEANKEGQLKYNTTSLEAKAGKVSIDFTNNSPEGHNVTIESSSKEEVGATETFTGGSKTLTATLKPGTYKFFCSVPGHRMAGMEGTLTVK
jgi:plastocyanin